jgi:diguanylate cyclase (GGDEF)-like protein
MNKELLNNIKVLYVEDEDDVREFTGKTIGAIVKEVIVAENGKVGLDLFLENQDIDLIVTDINMPKMGGLEMCAKIKEVNNSIPIVVTSAHNDPNFLKKAIDVGVNAYAMKPVDLYQLIENITKAVEPFYLKKQLEEINHSLEDKVEEGIQKIKSILDTQDNLILVTNGDSIENANKKFLNFFDTESIEDFLLQSSCVCKKFIKEDGFYSYDDDKPDMSWMMQVKRTPSVDRIVKMLNINNEEVIFAINIDKYTKINDHYVISFTDITEIKTKSNLLEYQANHDTLTGLYNRKKFYEIYSKEIKREKRYTNNLSIILFDLDHFKLFNDDFGHDIGDLALKAVANISQESIREHDTIVRWGGEEFIILLPETNIDGAKIVAEKLRNEIELHVDENIPRTITASFGITCLHDDDDENSFVKRVDKALYQAKDEGRNRVVTNS